MRRPKRLRASRRASTAIHFRVLVGMPYAFESSCGTSTWWATHASPVQSADDSNVDVVLVAAWWGREFVRVIESLTSIGLLHALPLLFGQ